MTLSQRLVAAALLAATLLLPAAAAPGDDPADRYVQNLFSCSGLPGLAVAEVEGDRLTYARGFGTDGGNGTVTPDTPFIIGSTSKSFTALAILQLVEARKLDIDAPAARYLPGFLHGADAGRRITLRMLLNQTSGVSHEAGDQPVWTPGETGPLAIRHFALSLDGAALDRPPGTSFEYSNANYVVLGAIVEIASGQRYADYLARHVFVPLGMTRSRAFEAGPVSRGHKQVFGINYVSDLPYAQGFVPAGFIVSTARDIARYLSAQLPGSAHARALGLSDAGIALWHRGTVPADPRGKTHYAMGWMSDTFNGLPVVFHNGDTGVFSSEFALDLVHRRAVVALSNGSGWLAGDYLHEIVSGVLNMRADRTPRDDAFIHRMVLAIYLAILAIPMAQALALWFMRRRKAGMLGRLWPVALHAIAAAGLLYALPRVLIGIPFAELFTSFPDLAWAALLSGALAAFALVRAVQPRSSAASPRSTASASAV